MANKIQIGGELVTVDVKVSQLIILLQRLSEELYNVQVRVEKLEKEKEESSGS